MAEIQAKDDIKKELVASKGITLIAVPGWWDGRIERYIMCREQRDNQPLTLALPLHHSLAATIKKARPDLLQDYIEPLDSAPISEEMPPRYLDKTLFEVEGIGEPVTACFFTNATIDPAKWY